LIIARKNIKIESKEEFSVNSLLEISEIGMPVSDIETVANIEFLTVDLKILCDWRRKWTVYMYQQKN
jgi:hypothetical protein